MLLEWENDEIKRKRGRDWLFYAKFHSIDSCQFATFCRTEKVSVMRVVVGQGSLHINDAEEANIEIEKHFVHPKWE